MDKIRKQSEAFAEMIGGLLVNFGALEFSSYRWVGLLADDTIVRDLAIDMQLSKRIALIKRLVSRSNWPENKKKTAVALWDEVSKLAKIRNTVAHNPIRIEAKADGTVVSGVINVKDMRGVGPYKTVAILPHDVAAAGRCAGKIQEQLGLLIQADLPKRAARSRSG